MDQEKQSICTKESIKSYINGSFKVGGPRLFFGSISGYRGEANKLNETKADKAKREGIRNYYKFEADKLRYASKL